MDITGCWLYSQCWTTHPWVYLTSNSLQLPLPNSWITFPPTSSENHGLVALQYCAIFCCIAKWTSCTKENNTTVKQLYINKIVLSFFSMSVILSLFCYLISLYTSNMHHKVRSYSTNFKDHFHPGEIHNFYLILFTLCFFKTFQLWAQKSYKWK